MHLEQHQHDQTGGEGEQIKEVLNDEAHWAHCLDYVR